MKKTTRHGLGRQFMKASLLGLSAMLLGSAASAQLPYSNNYVFLTTPYTVDDLDELKGYSTAVIPSAALNDESVMAGTIYDNVNGNPIHPNFFKVDATGQIINSTNKQYIDMRMTSERVVDVELNAMLGNDYTYITCATRPNNPIYPAITAGGGSTVYPTIQDRDGIKVIKVDNSNGNNLDEILGYTNFPNSGNYGHSLYPMSSMYTEVTGNPRLYICGFYTPDDTRCAGCPLYGTVNQDILLSTNNKQAFVTYVDLDPSTGDFMMWGPIKFFNSPTGTNVNNFDFDIAMRMKEYKGDILVTGSVNAKTGTSNAGYVRSGTLMLRINADLNLPAVLMDDVSFISTGNQDGFGPNEYGMAIEPRDDPNSLTTDRIYVIGNKYPTNLAFEDTTVGFNQQPDQIYVAEVNHYKISPFNLSWAFYRLESETGKYWVTNSLTASAPQITTNNTFKLLAAGFMTDNHCTFPAVDSTQSASLNNVHSFLLDLEINPGISIATNTTPTISQFGNQSSTKGFNTLGGAISNMYFHPAFADRDEEDSAPVLNAPKYWQPDVTLGLKIMHAQPNPTGTGSGASPYVENYYSGCGAPSCELQFEAVVQEAALTVVEEQGNLVNDMVTKPDAPYQEVWIGDCDKTTTRWPDQFKPGGLTAAATEVVAVYPNPVSDVLNISNAEGADYVVMDITGRAISTGTLSSTQATINVTSLADGMYMLHLTKGAVVNKVKFVKQ